MPATSRPASQLAPMVEAPLVVEATMLLLALALVLLLLLLELPEEVPEDEEVEELSLVPFCSAARARKVSMVLLLVETL